MTAASPDSIEQTPTPRRRWHAVAIVVTVLAFAVGVFLNVPGEPIIGPDILDIGKYGPHFECYPQYVAHGWPFRFLKHLGPPSVAANWGKPLSPWGIGVSPEVHWWKLTANIAIVLFSSLLLGWLAKRHLTKYGYGFGLANVGLLLLLIGCVLGYGTYRYRLQQAQLRVISSAINSEEATSLEWEPFGPYWLRSLTGNKFWNWGDRLVAIYAEHVDDIETFPGRSTIKVLRLGDINLDEPPSLAGYTRLAALDLTWSSHFSDEPPDAHGDDNLQPLMHEIAKCQTIEGLNLYDNGVTDRDVEVLSTLPKLKHLDLSDNNRITDVGLIHLGSIKSLRMLGLWGTQVTKQGVEKLQAELPNCEINWEGMEPEPR